MSDAVIIMPTVRNENKNDAVVKDTLTPSQQLAIVKSPAKKTRHDLYEIEGIRVEKGADGLEYCFEIATGKAICGSKLRNKDRICRQSPLKGRNRCDLHGGSSPRGIASATFKNAKYSKDLSSRLAQRYEDAVRDDRLLELREEIALVEVRVGDLLTRVDTGESGAIWMQVRNSYNDLRKAAAANDQQKFADALNEMGRIIVKGQGDYAAWDEVFKAIGQRRRLVETERKRLVDLQQMMTAEQAMSMLGFVVSTVKGKAYELLDRSMADQLLSHVTAEINRFISANQSYAKG